MPKGRRPERPIYLTINVFLPSEADTIEGDSMAKIDELQASFDELEAAVREFMTGAGSGVATLQQEIANLRADDAVEDTKIDGMRNAVQNLTQMVKTLRDSAEDALPNGSEPLPDAPHPDQALPGDLPSSRNGDARRRMVGQGLVYGARRRA